MKVVEILWEEPLVLTLGWTMVHFLWQGALVAALLAGIHALLRRHSAQLRYVVSCTALGLLVGMPLVTIYFVHPASTSAPLYDSPLFVQERIDGRVNSALSVDRALGLSGHLNGQSQNIEGSFIFLAPLLPWLVFFWLGGIGVFFMRYTGGWIYLQYMKRWRSNIVQQSYQVKLLSLMQRLDIDRPVRLLESALIKVPTVVGWLRPVILLPIGIMTGLTAQQAEALLVHELIHIRRHDYLVNLIQVIAETLLFFHPATWWISRRIDREREYCCDDASLAFCGSVATYTRMLYTIEELRSSPPPLAVAASGHSLLDRIGRLVANSASYTVRPERNKTSFLSLSTLLTLVVSALFVGMFSVSPALAIPEIAKDLSVDVGTHAQSTAWADFDRDGDLELFIGHDANTSFPQNFNRLYDLKEGKFDSIAHRAGVAYNTINGPTSSVAWADFDNDGWIDLFAAIRGHNTRSKLYKNMMPDTVFVDVAESVGAHVKYAGVSAWVDYDNDGDADLFASRDTRFSDGDEIFGGAQLLLENEAGQFADAAAEVGLQFVGQTVSSPLWFDCNTDGFSDLLLFHRTASAWEIQVHLNNVDPDQRFTAVGSSVHPDPVAAYANGYPTPGDIDNDGDLDLYIANHGARRDQLLRNDSADAADCRFTSIAEEAQIDTVSLSYGAAFGDIDNDGDLDLQVAHTGPGRLYRNEGGEFVELTGTAFYADGGGHDRSGTFGDYDNDGDLDFYSPYSQSGQDRFYRNDQENGHHWIQIELVGAGKDQDGDNVAGIGAEVVVTTTADRKLTRVVNGGSYGSGSQDALRLHFGLGNEEIKEIAVYWPTAGRAQPQIIQVKQIKLDALNIIHQALKVSDSSRYIAEPERPY